MATPPSTSAFAETERVVVRTADIMGRKSTQLGPTRAQLIDMGLLFTPEHGYAEFTVPHFDKFMLRAITELVVPPPRPRKKGNN